MTPWQVLRAGRARAALGYRGHHGPGPLVHYSTAMAVTPDSSRSFCLSKDKVTLQHLNMRLASYLHQVRCLEAANQKLERQIQEELGRKCPGELRELDRHLRPASLLQDQIGECLSAQAQVRLQLLNAELYSSDLKDRCEKEHEHRSRLEASLNDLKELGEELTLHKLPELQSWLSDHSQQLMELQIQHQQDMQGSLAQVSGGVTVKMQTTGSSDLIRQLNDLRQTNATLMTKNQSEGWVNTQGSMLSSPVVTFDPAAKSEVDQVELEELRRTAACLEEDLRQLHALNAMLENSGLEQTESFVLQLEVLQQTADRLCGDLDSVLQATAQQGADHETLLDIKTRLETEINNYKRLLDGQSKQKFLGLHSDTMFNTPCYQAPTSPSAFRRNITVDRTLSVQGGNVRVYQCQNLSRDKIRIIKKTPVLTPFPETFTKSQTIRDISKHPKSQTVGSVNTKNRTGSVQKSENKRVVGSQISQSFNKRTVVKTSTPEINTAKTTLSPDKQSARSVSVQAKPETPTSKQTTTEAFKQITIHTEIAKVTVDVEPSVKVEYVKTQKNISDPSRQTATEAKTETKTVIFSQVNFTEGSNQAKNQGPSQVLTPSLKTPAEDIRDTEEDDIRASDVKGLNTQVKASTESFLMNGEDNERKKKTKEIEVLTDASVSSSSGLDQKSVLTDSNGEQNKVTEGADTVPCRAMNTPFGSQESNGIAESTASIVSESHTQRSEEAQGGLSCELSSRDDANVEVADQKEEKEVRGEEISFALEVVQSSVCNALNSVPIEPMEDSETGSDVALHCPDTELDLESKTEVVNSSGDVHNVIVDPAEIDKEMINLAGKEAHLSTTESKKSTSRKDSGVALSLSSTEELLNPGDGPMFIMSPTKSVTDLRPEICLSPIDTDLLMSMSDQVFCPVDLDIRSPDSLLSPEDQEMFLSPNDDTCLSPVEIKECLSPNFEDYEETCLSPTEANVHVRPVEKYVLTTKDEGQSLSFSGDQALPKEDRNKNINISVRDGDSVCFGSFEDKVSRVGVNGANKSCKLTSQGIGSHPGGSKFNGPGERGVIADKEEQLGFKGLYRRPVVNAPSPRDRNKGTGDNADIKKVHNQYSSQGGTLSSEGSGESPSGATLPVTSRPESGSFARKGSGEWAVYSTLGRRSSVDDGSSLPKEEKEQNSATSAKGTGRFGSGGSGEWKVYGRSPERKSSFPGTRSEVTMLLATSPPDTKFGSVGNGEQAVNSGSLKRAWSLGGSDDLPNTERRESQPTALQLATSPPPETGRFGSRGSGEWRVYGRDTGRISRWSASSSLPNADNKESSLADRQLAMSPPTTSPVAIPRTGRFSGGGSGEWRVYGGSPGRLSSASSADCSRVISPPSSAQRLGSSGSGDRLSSGGVVRRSSSVGSGGRLSGTSGSHMVSSPVRYASTGSGEWKPVYSSVSGRGSSAGSAGTSGGVGNTSSHRALSPGGRMNVSMGSGGWLSGSAAGGSHTSSTGSGSKLSIGGSNDRISQPGGRITSSSGSGRTNSTGGRVISSSSRSNRSTGSGAGSSKERISVCKMAALSISAAGRERRKDKKTQAQKPAGTSPVVQRWLTTGVGVTSADPEVSDDIMHL